MDQIIFGDNQFFGISHMSEERGTERARKFQNTNAIIEVLDAAYDCGIHAFSFSTHDRVQQICDHFRANSSKYTDLRLYPVLPYAYKYAHLVNEKGMVGALRDVLVTDNTAGQIASIVFRGGAAAITQDPMEIMKLLIDAELKMFRGLNMTVIFLQNVITDLLLGLAWKSVFVDFADYIERRYKARTGFMTVNMPRLVDFLLSCGMENPIVCAPINKAGFQMNPDIESYERTLDTKPFTAMAMSILAAGAVQPRQAVQYIAALKSIKAVMFGASSRNHISQTKALLDELFVPLGMA